MVTRKKVASKKAVSSKPKVSTTQAANSKKKVGKKVAKKASKKVEVSANKTRPVDTPGIGEKKKPISNHVSVAWPGGTVGREYWIASMFKEKMITGPVLDPSKWVIGKAVEATIVASYFSTTTVLSHHLNKTFSLVRVGMDIQVNDLKFFQDSATGLKSPKANTSQIRDWRAVLESGEHTPGTSIAHIALIQPK